jgi:hypothetical protein
MVGGVLFEGVVVDELDARICVDRPVAAAPPLTGEQRARLAVLLGPVRLRGR